MRVVLISVLLVVAAQSVSAQEALIQSVPVLEEHLSNSRTNSTLNSYVMGRYPDNFQVFQHLLKPLTSQSALYSCAPLVWDGRVGLLCTTGLNLRSHDDPVDIRMVRVGGGTIYNPDYDAPLYPGALIGQIGSSVILNRDIKSYESLFQFYTNNNRTGYICVAFGQGRDYVTRAGQVIDKDESPCIFLLSSSGQLVVGADTVTRFTSIVIHGDMVVDGCLVVGGKVLAGECKGDVQEAAKYEAQILSMRERTREAGDLVVVEQK